MSVWVSLLETAIHSPSPHNVQPWRVRILNEREADLFIDSTRTLPKEDLTGSFIILTMGMFIEALRLLAAHSGFALRYTIIHEPAWYAHEILKCRQQTFIPFAHLSLTPDQNLASDINPALFLKRRTSRLSLKPDPVPAKIADELSALAVIWNQRYEQITDSKTIERIVQKNIEAVFEDLNNPDYHDEIVQWFRFTKREALATRDGLDYRCMNTSRTAYWLTARLPQLLQMPLTHNILTRIYRSQLGLIPTIGMLAGDFWAAESALMTGSFLMRFWLETARYDLYIHPYGNLVTNKRAADWLLKETGVRDIWLIFKIGFSNEPPQSYRRSLEEILLA